MKKIAIIFILSFSTYIFSQSSKEIRKSVINGNNIQTEVWNYGSISSPGALSQVNDFVWNGLGYLYEFGTLISAEVVDIDGDTLQITSDSFVRITEGDYNPGGTLKWGWLPVEGYANSSQSKIANSNKRETWHETWAYWPGEYGNGITAANTELYYKMNDFTNFEFIDKYQPFLEDYTRGGLGVSAEVRIYQFVGGLEDAVIIKYFITNESDKDLEKVYFGFQGDPHIGGSTDYGDDIARIVNTSYSSNTIKSQFANKTIYVFDLDDRGAGNKSPGFLSFNILESPDDKGLTSFHALQWGEFDVKEDEKMWEFFSTGIDTVNYLYDIAGDNAIHFGTGPFTLGQGETKIIKAALFLSKDYFDVLEDATYISLHHNWALVSSNIGENGGNDNYRIKLNDLPDLICGENEISWSYTGSANDAKVFLEYSNNNGTDWFPLNVELNANETFTWNTIDVDDGKNYIIRAIAYNEINPKEYYFDISSSRFTIDNPEFNAKPELEILTTFNDTTISQTPVNIEWIAEDADNSDLEIKIEYSLNGGNLTEINSNIYPNGKNVFVWDPTNFPNADDYYLKITASDGEKDSSLYSDHFKVNIFESTLTDAHIKSYRGNSNPIIQIQTINENELTADEYSIKFNVDESGKTFNVKNITSDEILISDYPVSPFLSTPLIDGMKITVEDSGNEIDFEQSRFAGPNSNFLDFQVRFPPVLGAPKVKVDEDFLFIFNDPDTTSNGDWLYADTLETLMGTIFAPFSVWSFNGKVPDFEFLEPATFVLYEPNRQKQRNGKWDWGEEIILQPLGTTDATTTFQISFVIENDVYPQDGDSLYVITYNEIEDNDEFRFSPDSNFVVKVQNVKLENSFSLSQNYPNPFNPTTTIKYSLPVVAENTLATGRQVQSVQLIVYDVLGREVKTLVNQNQSPGEYQVVFNASSLSSGIYFYRLKVAEFIETKKMILLR